MAQRRELRLGDRPPDADQVFLVELRGRSNDRLRQHAVLGQDEQPVRIHVEPAERGEAGVSAGNCRALADEGAGGQQPHRRDLAFLRLRRHDANGLVQHDAEVALLPAACWVRQHEGLAGLDLAAQVADRLAVDGDEPSGDQVFGFPARADPVLGQPAVYPLGLGLMVAAGPGHRGILGVAGASPT